MRKRVLLNPQYIPSGTLKHWQAYRRELARDAKEHVPPIVISRTVWNAIRNAWKDGYWTRFDAEPRDLEGD
jgi:hypothetical protein